jgi:hypothetical protein
MSSSWLRRKFSTARAACASFARDAVRGGKTQRPRRDADESPGRFEIFEIPAEKKDSYMLGCGACFNGTVAMRTSRRPCLSNSIRPSYFSFRLRSACVINEWIYRFCTYSAIYVVILKIKIKSCFAFEFRALLSMRGSWSLWPTRLPCSDLRVSNRRDFISTAANFVTTRPESCLKPTLELCCSYADCLDADCSELPV